ncbi:HlyD family secretion protein [Effusibacillus dendaii]|uniref:Multidrug resistance protein A n=1 Tax=Effusibacillus dendaii TaxID=2743772 RepID=A0A7I8DG25_9BACL|nr:HlyD family efflux transporter periplasmic adaptor subunit [Effusibacillus dendaii]BCJ87816.1 multidrug resistance protein A [Effusibacillus dendaii]
MNSARVLVVNILVLVLLIAGGVAAFYFYIQSANYVSTDNARIDGQQVTIYATAGGQLTDWNGDIGKRYNAGDRVGTISAGAPAAAAGGVARVLSAVDLIFPINATIVQQTAVRNAFVAPGTPLARAYDMDHLWVTANVNETNINDVKTGQAVDVYVDAFPGTTLTGRVDKIGLSTASNFSMLPASNTTANYTKVTQVIPVTVRLDGYKGLNIVPGMSASVRIHM